MENYLTTDEVAEMFRTSPASVRFWRTRNTGPRGTRYGRRVLYAESEVRRWAEEQAAKDLTATR